MKAYVHRLRAITSFLPRRSFSTPKVGYLYARKAPGLSWILKQYSQIFICSPLITMHSYKLSESPGSLDSSAHDSDENPTPAAPSDQAERPDKDVMCLVYPDGRLIMVEPEPKPD